MGSIAIAAAASKSSGSSTFIIFIIIIIGALYFLVMRPGRNRQKRVQQQQNQVAPGARVRTTAGMYATVVAVDGDDVILEVAPDVEVRYMKRAIMEVIGDVGAPAEDETDEDATDEHDDGGYDDTEHEDAEHDGAVDEDAAHEDAEHDANVPAAGYGDDLVINGSPDRTGTVSGNGSAETNGDHPGTVTPESKSSKE